MYYYFSKVKGPTRTLSKVQGAKWNLPKLIFSITFNCLTQNQYSIYKQIHVNISNKFNTQSKDFQVDQISPQPQWAPSSSPEWVLHRGSHSNKLKIHAIQSLISQFFVRSEMDSDCFWFWSFADSISIVWIRAEWAITVDTQSCARDWRWCWLAVTLSFRFFPPRFLILRWFRQSNLLVPFLKFKYAFCRSHCFLAMFIICGIIGCVHILVLFNLGLEGFSW